MGSITFPDKVKLIAGILFNTAYHFSFITSILEEKFGNIDLQSEIFRFTDTDYYNREMGNEIYRVYISFDILVNPACLPEIKIITNQTEEKYKSGNNRNINIDPGYIELSKLVLASTKNYSHRIYLDKGIYAEPTLHFSNGSFTNWPFSYPDYSSEKSVVFFNKVRKKYKEQLKNI